MSYRTSLIVGALALVLITTSADAAQRTRRKVEEPPPPPPQFRVDVAKRRISIERFNIAIPVGTAIGKFTEGCFGASILNGRDAPLYSDNAFRNVPPQDFMNEFIAEANAASYNLATQQTGDLFNTDSAKAELIVGANVLTLKEDACLEQVLGFLSGTRAEATMSVDWQVFDPLAKKIVFRATNQGVGKDFIKGQESFTIPIDGARAAFRDAAKNILADPNFVAALKDTSGGAPAPPNGGLLSNESTPQASASQEIPRVPLRTAAFQDQIPDLRQQVVTIVTPQGTGSGFYISDGLLLTNHHVIEGFTKIKVRFFGGRELPGEVLRSDAQRDIALVKVEGGGMTGLPIQFDKPRVGAQTYVIGSPLGQEQEGTVTSGIVSALRTSERGPVIQSDIAVTKGNSGGPMFDDKGNVLGVVDYGRLNNGVAVDLNFFIPIDDALRVLHVSVAGMPTAPATVAEAGGREILVYMYPADGPLMKSGKTQAVPGKVGGVGTAGTFAFTRPDGVSCDGKWTTLQSQPSTDSLLTKYGAVTGISSKVSGMVGGLALGACSNSATFQAEYYVVPTADSGFGVATDSNGNVYKIIF